jgi:glycerol-3-phosphate dehydrogenase
MQPVALSPGRRARDLEQLFSERFDVLVIGGGITGAGAALDAAGRGLRVALVEAQDFGAGTSSRSSKLIHGGLRYLEMLDFRLIREALRERGLLLERIAPHLVHPVRILYPLKRPVLERAYVGAGVALYNLLALSTRSTRGVATHRHVSRRGALALDPGLKRESLVGAVLYSDAQVDDARFVVEVVRTAVSLGATALSRTAATGFVNAGGRVVGVNVRDLESGTEGEVRASTTIVATGPWTEDTEALAGCERAMRVRPSKGVHVLVPRTCIDLSTALILRTAKSVLFVLPWGSHWLIGTTDTEWGFEKARPVANAGDVQYILDEVNRWLRHPIAASDVVSTYAGLRPLVAGVGVVRGPRPGQSRAERGRVSPGATAKMSREHAIGRPAPGLVVVSGGKYTTYRVMAKDAVDAAVEDRVGTTRRSVSDRQALVGAEGYRSAWAERSRRAEACGLALDHYEHLLLRYGGLAEEVVGLFEEDPALREPISADLPYLAAEAVYAVTHEGARHLADVLERRTRLAIEEPSGAAHLAEPVANLIGPLLGWDASMREAEISDFKAQAALIDDAAHKAADDLEAARLVDAAPSLFPLP